MIRSRSSQVEIEPEVAPDPDALVFLDAFLSEYGEAMEKLARRQARCHGTLPSLRWLMGAPAPALAPVADPAGAGRLPSPEGPPATLSAVASLG